MPIYVKTIEEDLEYATQHGPPYSVSTVVCGMEMVHYDEWVNCRRDGNTDRMIALATKYGAKFKDINFDMLFRAEYKMLKGPLPNTLFSLIHQCWDFSQLK